MAALLVSRLVSGLAVTSKAATLPLVRPASGDTAKHLVFCLTTGSWRRWPSPDYDSTWSSPDSASAISQPTQVATSSAPAHVPTARRTVVQPASATGSLFSDLPSTPFARTCHAVAFRTVTTSSSVASSASTASAPVSGQAHSPAGNSRMSVSDSATGLAADSRSGSGSSLPGEQDVFPVGDVKPDLVEKFLSLDVCNSRARRQAERQEVLQDFQRHPADTGSPAVMVALWTHRARSLVKVFDAGRKQLPAIRQLEMLVNRRRRMLTWLRRTDFESYSYTISKLGLRDIYVPAGGADRYREGTRPTDAVDDQINRLRFNFHTKYRQGKTSMWYRLRPKLVAEDPVLQAADADAAVEDRQRRQQRREVAAKQRMAVEREQRK